MGHERSFTQTRALSDRLRELRNSSGGRWIALLLQTPIRISYAHCSAEREKSHDWWERPQDLTLTHDLTVCVGSDGAELAFNDWSFSQACRMAGVSKDTINRLTPKTSILPVGLRSKGRPSPLAFSYGIAKLAVAVWVFSRFGSSGFARTTSSGMPSKSSSSHVSIRPMCKML